MRKIRKLGSFIELLIEMEESWTSFLGVWDLEDNLRINSKERLENGRQRRGDVGGMQGLVWPESIEH